MICYFDNLSGKFKKALNDVVSRSGKKDWSSRTEVCLAKISFERAALISGTRRGPLSLTASNTDGMNKVLSHLIQ